MSNFVGDVNSSGCRNAEGSSCRSLQDCISFLASKVVGLSAALATESTVRGKLAAERDKCLPPLPSWCLKMTNCSPCCSVEIKGDVLLPCKADLRQLGLWSKSRCSVASPKLIWERSSCRISNEPRLRRLSSPTRYANVKAYRRNVILAFARWPKSSTPSAGIIISTSKDISSSYVSPTR